MGRHVAAYQWDLPWENKPANYEQVRRRLESARLPKNSLLALPEMFSTGFSRNVNGITEASHPKRRLAGSQEALLAAELDPTALREWRTHFPALRDRRNIGCS